MKCLEDQHFLNFSFALQIDREFRILSALHSVSFPVPKPYLYCEDVSVIGTEFYIMEHVKVKTESYSIHENWLYL